MSVGVDTWNPWEFEIDIFDFNVGVNLNGNLNLTVPTSYSIGISTIPPIEIKPIDFSLRLKEFPSIRAHLPLNYKVGFSLLGRELACINLCGQGQVITEPYVPYPCEFVTGTQYKEPMQEGKLSQTIKTKSGNA